MSYTFKRITNDQTLQRADASYVPHDDHAVNDWLDVIIIYISKIGSDEEK